MAHERAFFEFSVMQQAYKYIILNLNFENFFGLNININKC